jgi:ELWxxDGT repeat protein
MLFFAAFDATSGQELWSSDGTATGTTQVKDIYPGADGSYPYELIGVGNNLFFKANDGTNGAELWKASALPGPATGGGGPAPVTTALTFNLKAAIARCKKKFPKGPKRKKCIRKARAKANA